MYEICPYIASVLCALISGLCSYFASAKQYKSEIRKLNAQHEYDLKIEQEKHVHEVEKMKLEFHQQLELREKENNDKLVSECLGTLFTNMMSNSDFQKVLSNEIKKSQNSGKAKRW